MAHLSHSGKQLPEELANRRRRSAFGFTYLAMLFAVAVSGAALASLSVVWTQEARRAREHELLLIGEEFRRAIGLYYERTPGAIKRYPDTLEDLLRDGRYLSTQRYLRRIYRDPITGKADWDYVFAPSGGIMGIHSRSEATPLKISGFDEIEPDFEGKRTYSSWSFVYTPPLQYVNPPKLSTARDTTNLR